MQTITEIEGDLFDAPDGAALVHACNCQGSWGKGIAQAFRERYPAAFAIYRYHCRTTSPKDEYKTIDKPGLNGKPTKIRSPEGTALIIPPQRQDYEGKGEGKGKGVSKRHWIICLFTSRQFGKNVSPPATILTNTELAIADMKEQLVRLGEDGDKATEGGDGGESEMLAPGELWSCRFNSGLFRVDWSRSKQIMEDAGLEVTVVRPPGVKL